MATKRPRFQRDITDFIRVTGLRQDLVLRKLGLDAIYGVQLRSPVKTGRFRASHRISINEIDLTVEPKRTTLASSGIYNVPAGLIQKSRGIVVKAKFGDTILITNNLPYARKLENGYSKQNPGPDGIYGATFAELTMKFAQTVAAVKAQNP